MQAPGWTRVRITPSHWHWVAIGVLCLINLVLVVRLVFAWQAARVGDAAHLQQHKAEYREMQLKTRPLRGLDKKINQAQQDEHAFYQKRFPANYSEVLSDLGALATKNDVLLSRVQYGQGKLVHGVYELRINAALTGDYAPIVRFINGLERDNNFFLIRGIALNGQENGIVTLRMMLTTYLRAPAPKPDTTSESATKPNDSTLASVAAPAGQGRR